MDTPRQFQALADGEIDVGIVRPRRQCPSGIVAAIVQTERLMVAMARNHPLASRRRLSARDLKGQAFISPQFDEDEGFSDVLAALGAAGEFSVNLDYRVQDFISAISLASAGYGIVVVPESMRNFAQPGICYRAVADFDVPVHLALASRRREPSPAVRAFVKASLDGVVADD